MHHHNAVMGVPKHGRGAHPDPSKTLALDGRTHNKLSRKEGAQRNLYWLIERTSNNKQANLVIEQAQAKMTLALTLPSSKKVINDKWDKTEMPLVPLITNNKPIKARTRLMVFHKTK